MSSTINHILKEIVDKIKPEKEDSDKIKVVSVAELFATAILHTIEHKSISSLFIKGLN